MLTAENIAGLVGGELRGAPDTAVGSIAPLDRAGRSQLSILSDARYVAQFQRTCAGVVVMATTLADASSAVPSRVIVSNPHEALIALIPAFYPATPSAPSIHPTARIGRGAQLGHGISLDEYCVIGDGAVISDGVRIGAHCFIAEGTRVGRSSKLFPGVTLYRGSELGERVILHSGVRVASDGFGYVSTAAGHARIPHVGRCIIGDDVEIGANTTVDRGSIDDTVIGSGTKIDNLVQIAHNVRIGNRCLIMSQVGIAGSARIGDGCVIAGQAGLAGHITVGDGARIGGQAGVFGDVPAGETWSGYPARPHREALRASGALFKLSGMLKRIERLLEERDGH